MKDSSMSAGAETDLKKYELMVIINPDIGQDATKVRLTEIKKLISDRDGEIFFEDVWGLRDLAYRIKKQNRGFYVVLDFTIMPEHIKDIDVVLRLEREILRHMIVTLPFKFEPKSYAVLEEKAEPVAKADPKAVKSVKKEYAKTEKAKPAEAAVSTATAKAEVKKDKKDTSLEEVDAKLKSIIDNPDINF